MPSSTAAYVCIPAADTVVASALPACRIDSRHASSCCRRRETEQNSRQSRCLLRHAAIRRAVIASAPSRFASIHAAASSGGASERRLSYLPCGRAAAKAVSPAELTAEDGRGGHLHKTSYCRDYTRISLFSFPLAQTVRARYGARDTTYWLSKMTYRIRTGNASAVSRSYHRDDRMLMIAAAKEIIEH